MWSWVRWGLVAGDLVDDEPIERQVAVQRVDHPIAIEPDPTWLVLFKAVAVGIAGRVEPFATPALAVVWRSQESIDNFFIASGDLSATNASTSAGVGGRPIRSSVRRRISVVRSASGDGRRPSFPTGRERNDRDRCGTIARLSPPEATAAQAAERQCAGFALPPDRESGHGAPSSIHRFSMPISDAESRLPFGGIISSLSLDMTRRSNSLFSQSLATMAGLPLSPPRKAFSRMSSRNPAVRLRPWSALVAVRLEDRQNVASEIDRLLVGFGSHGRSAFAGESQRRNSSKRKTSKSDLVTWSTKPPRQRH